PAELSRGLREGRARGPGLRPPLDRRRGHRSAGASLPGHRPHPGRPRGPALPARRTGAPARGGGGAGRPSPPDRGAVVRRRRAVSVPAVDVKPGGACRFCHAPLAHIVADLGVSPLCEAYVPADGLSAEEPVYPLCAYVCDECWLVQVPEHVPPESIFTEYAYFSSYSDSWLAHAAAYVRRVAAALSRCAASRAGAGVHAG